MLKSGALLAQLPLAARPQLVLSGSYLLATGAALTSFMLALPGCPDCGVSHHLHDELEASAAERHRQRLLHPHRRNRQNRMGMHLDNPASRRPPHRRRPLLRRRHHAAARHRPPGRIRVRLHLHPDPLTSARRPGIGAVAAITRQPTARGMPACPDWRWREYPPTCRRTTFGMTVSLQAGRRGEPAPIYPIGAA